MKSFRTSIELPELGWLQKSDPVATVGSCFSDAFGTRLQAYKWEVAANPFGIQYHPLAICSLLQSAIDEEALPETLFLEHDGAVYHYFLPRTIFAESKEALEEIVRTRRAHLRDVLLKPRSVLFLTFGTAFVYEKEGQWVANCHQQNMRLFQKRLLTIEEMISAFADLLKVLPAEQRIVLTLSPVRHIRDTMPLNSLSKALLRVFIHEVLQRWPERCSYFPAYEIVMDDLRDYRFYAEDMIHPNEVAIDYIWSLFLKSYVAEEAQRFVKEWTGIRARLLHRPQRPSSPAAQAFAKQLLQDLDRFPNIDVAEERARILENLQPTRPE